MRVSSRRRLVFGVGLVVSAVFVVLTLWKVDFGALGASLASVSLPILALSVLTKGVSFGMMTVRSQLLTRPLHRYTWSRQVRSVLLGFVGNNVLPFRAGELLRIGYLARHGEVPASSVLAVIALERLLDLFCLLIVFLGVLPLMVVDLQPDGSMLSVAFVLVLAVAGAVATARWPLGFLRLAQMALRPWPGPATRFVLSRAERFALGLGALSSWRVLAGVIGTSLGYWAVQMLGVQIWLWAFGLQLPWYAPLVITVYLAFGTLLPSAPSFVGTYHYFASAGLAVFGVAAATCTSFGIVGHAVAFLPWTLIGIPLVFGDLVLGRRSLDPVEA